MKWMSLAGMVFLLGACFGSTPLGTSPSPSTTKVEVEATPSPRLTALRRGVDGNTPTPADWIVFQMTEASVSIVPLSATELGNDWIAVYAQAANQGNRAANLTGKLRLRDNQSRLYESLSYVGNPSFMRQLSALKAGAPEGHPDIIDDSTDIQPGRDAVLYLTFQVAPDSTVLHLEGRP